MTFGFTELQPQLVNPSRLNITGEGPDTKQSVMLLRRSQLYWFTTGGLFFCLVVMLGDTQDLQCTSLMLQISN